MDNHNIIIFVFVFPRPENFEVCQKTINNNYSTKTLLSFLNLNRSQDKIFLCQSNKKSADNCETAI